MNSRAAHIKAIHRLCLCACVRLISAYYLWQLRLAWHMLSAKMEAVRWLIQKLPRFRTG